MPNESINISPSEWEVMEILWDEFPLSAADVIEKLHQTDFGKPDWSPKTIRTFLSRLVQKQCLRQAEIEGILHFEPIVDRESTVRKASHCFLNQFFDGTLSSMFAHFIRQEDISSEELDQLRRLLLNDSVKGESDKKEPE